VHNRRGLKRQAQSLGSYESEIISAGLKTHHDTSNEKMLDNNLQILLGYKQIINRPQKIGRSFLTQLVPNPSLTSDFARKFLINFVGFDCGVWFLRYKAPNRTQNNHHRYKTYY
jgi:hypothetical protein